ncbi:MAG: acyltransferase [Tatlockia sp.]|nr:acyltransferase [Tatlockia sp.]
MKRIVFLDWLRIFSFTSVLIGHKFYATLFTLSQDESVHDSLKFVVKLFLPFCFAGGAGVVVFFLVSGYVITHVLQNEEPLTFFFKRVFRIYPLYICAVLLQYKLLHIPMTAHVLIPQLLLIGDFFDTPYTLNGVEWTLRVEILFYGLMFILRSLSLVGTKEYVLALILTLITLLLRFSPQLPGELFPNHGYLNIYGPFLFVGVFFWLYENKKIPLAMLGVFVSFVFIQHWILIDTILPAWRTVHFAGLAFLLFVALWSLRERLYFNGLILFLSELTYPVYLFHNWLFDYIKQWSFADGIFHHNRYALIMLFTISALAVKLIEKPGVRLGNQLIKYIRHNARALKLVADTY